MQKISEILSKSYNPQAFYLKSGIPLLEKNIIFQMARSSCTEKLTFDQQILDGNCEDKAS